MEQSKLVVSNATPDRGFGRGRSASDVESRMARQLDTLRRNLLDIGTRNRLIGAPFKSGRANVLEIVDEKADQILSALWRGNATFSFVHNEAAQSSGEAAGDD